MKCRIIELIIAMGLLSSNILLAQRHNSLTSELDTLKKNAQALQSYYYNAKVHKIVIPGLESEINENNPLCKQTIDITVGVFNNKHLVEVKCHDGNRKLFDSIISCYDGELWSWLDGRLHVMFFSKKRHRRLYSLAGTHPLGLIYGFINFKNDGGNMVCTYPLDIMNDVGWEQLSREAALIALDGKQFTFSVTGTDDYTQKQYFDEITVDKETYLPIMLKRYNFESNIKGALTYQHEIKEIGRLKLGSQTVYYPKTLEIARYHPPAVAGQERGNLYYTISTVVTDIKNINKDDDMDFSIDPTLAKAIVDVDRDVWIDIPK
ncbi:MAG: hypothetical protein LBK76_04970 [Verrucomicrobiales bacterium]|jgi:hypothetical protein|nr:hypothetical protein [Verrucomicrobiales bacterium]